MRVGRRHGLWRINSLIIALVLALLLMGGVAAAAWSDLTSEDLESYGITETQVEAISEGFTDGTWRPYAPMPRKQFTKMAVDNFGIALAEPGVPSFPDVSQDSLYYPYIEGAAEARLILGFSDGSFGPDLVVTREQAIAVVSRYAASELGQDLDAYSDSEIALLLVKFVDADQISLSLRAEVAFAVEHGLVRGNTAAQLSPRALLTRLQGAAILVRAGEELEGGGTTTTTLAPTTTTTIAPTTTTTIAPTTTTTLAPRPQLTRTDQGLLLSDNFTGADGAAWDANKWNVVTGGLGDADIENNHGHLQIGGAYSFAGGEAKADDGTPAVVIDAETTFLVEVENEERAYVVPWLRGDGNLAAADHYGYQNGYLLELPSSWETSVGGVLSPPYQASLWRRLDGDFDLYPETLREDSLDIEPSFGTFVPGIDEVWQVRYRVSGDQVLARFWLLGQPEPTTWKLEGADSLFSSGTFGLFFGVNGELGDSDVPVDLPIEAWIDDLELRSGHSITVNNLPVGYSVRVTDGAVSATVAATAGTAVVDVGSMWQEVDTVEVLDASDAVLVTVTPASLPGLGAGDVFSFSG